MAAVPTGPNTTLPTSPAKIIPFPGDGCDLLGEGEELVCRLTESVTPDKELEQEVGTCKRERGNKQKDLFSQPRSYSKGTEKQVNGLSCSNEDGLNQNHMDDSAPGQSMDLSVGGSKSITFVTNSKKQQGDGLCFNCQSNNSGTNAMLSSPQNDVSQSHAIPLDTMGINDTCGTAEMCPTQVEHPDNEAQETIQPERVPSDAVQVPVAELAGLKLNKSPTRATEQGEEIQYVRYESELQMPGIMRLITKDLSEPYSIYTYRYFIHNWPQLCFLAMVGEECVGAIVCKLDMHKKMFRRGYIAMLAVDSKHRRKSIGTSLVKKAIYAMVEGDCDEVVLETEITNKSALKLYENLGFVRDKRLFRYYLNGVDALRLKLWLR